MKNAPHEALYACNCPTSPRPAKDFPEIDVGSFMNGLWIRTGKTVRVCGWCKLRDPKPVLNGEAAKKKPTTNAT